MPEEIAGATPQTQAQPGQSDATQQTQQTGGATTTQPTAAPQQAQAQPSVEELQGQLAEERRQREVAANSAKHFQSLADQNAARLKALAGAEPQVDPLAPHINKLKAKGYSEEDARNILSVVNDMTAPIQQELTQSRAALHATYQIDSAINEAYKLDNDLFRDPRIAEHVRNELQQVAMSGQQQFVNAAYATACAEAAYANLNKPWKQNGAAPVQPQQTLPPPRMSFGGPPSGFTPAPPTQQTVNPMTESLTKQMADYVAIPKK